jgi:Zn-finger nucleic acid-binding protein
MSVATTVLIDMLGRENFAAVWSHARSAVRGGRNCPMCIVDMNQFTVGVEDEAITLDACINCMLIWLDDGEVEKLRVREEFFKRTEVVDGEKWSKSYKRSAEQARANRGESWAGRVVEVLRLIVEAD